MPKLILYPTADSQTSIKLRAEDGKVWLSQLEMAKLFATSKQNISHQVRRFFGRRRTAGGNR